MADITQIQVGSTTYDIHDEKHGAYYVKGTQTASTGTWTGNLPDVSELYNGLTIDYWLPFAGSGNATLNLTLKNGVTTGAVNCYYSGTSRLTTHIGANNIIRLTYQTVTISGTEYTGWWATKAYLDGNDRACYLYHHGAWVANSIIYRYQLLFQMDENTLTPLNNDNNVTGTTKTMLTNVEFDPFGAILYWESTSTINAGASISSTTPKYSAPFDLRYTFNCGTTLTAHKPFYLKVSMQSNGKVKIASTTPWAQALPTTADGYYYIYLGRTYSTYQLGMTPYHPVYFHDGTKIVELKNLPLASSTVNGYMSASDKAKLDGLDADDYASASHTHDASDITSGTLSASRGGTGKTTLGDAGNAIINALGEGTSQANRNDYIVAQYANGGTTTTTYHRRKLSNIFAALNSSDVTTALGFTPSANNHTHGNITNAGAITSDTAVASGDKIVVTDSSASSKLIRTGISFDGSTTTTALTPKGTWESFAKLGSPAFTGTPTAPTAADGTNSTQIATTAFVQSAFKANDAMIFKGTIGSSGATVSTLPATHYKGWTYKVATSGTYAGQSCEIGDTIICVTDGTSANDAHWTVIQANIDGAVTGPASATDAHVATFSGTSGKVIKDSGFTIGKSVPSDAKFTDTTYSNGDGISLSGTTFSAAFPTSGTPAALGTANNGTSNNVARADHVHAKPTYGNITTAGAITSDTAVASGDKIVVADSSDSSKLIRTGISFDGSTTSKALTPKGTWESFATPSGTPKYMDIGGVADYQRTVLALCELSENANSGTSSHTSGSIVTIRSNGLMPEYVANFVFQDRYSTAKSCHYSFFGNFENTSTELRTGEGFRACTFTYNSKFYGGLEFYQVQARRFYWTGEGTFTPFIVAYYNQNTSAVLNAEVNNSISHSTTTAVRLPLTVDDSKKVNGLTVQTAVPANAVFTDTKYTNGNGISLSGTTFSVAFPTSGTPAALGTASNGTSNNVARADHVHAKPTYSKSDVGLGNVTNDAQIAKAIGTAKGDIIYFSGSGAPERLAIGSNGQVLKVSSSGIPAWSSDTDTDTKVTNTLATTTKYYVTGTTTATTNTGTQSFDSGIYATTTAGQLNATTYKVNEQVTLQWNATDESLDFVFA